VVDLDTYELSGGDEQTKLEQINIDDQGHLKTVDETQRADAAQSGHKVLEPLAPAPAASPTPDDAGPTGTGLQPPTLGGTLTASGSNNETEQSVSPMAAVPTTDTPLLSQGSGVAPSQSASDGLPAGNTLADIEKSVQSPHVAETTAVSGDVPVGAPPVALSVDEARDTVNSLTSVSPGQPLPPIEALGAQYVDLPGVGGTAQDVPAIEPAPAMSAPVDVQPSQPTDPTAPPPVPPPMMPPSFTPTPPTS
jgi:hypothetical protein